MIDTDADFLTPSERHLTDTLLHDNFPREPQPDLYRQVAGVVVGATGRWVLAGSDGKPVYGHA